MANYYAMRREILMKVTSFFENREEELNAKRTPPAFSGMVTRLIREYGVTDKMIKALVESAYFGHVVVTAKRTLIINGVEVE